MFSYLDLFDKVIIFPMTMVKEFVGNNSIYIVRILGAFASFFLVGLYLILRDVGPDGAWTYYMFFAVGVVMLIYDEDFIQTI